MLILGGTATANSNVLSATELATLYRDATIEIRAVASAATPTVPTVTADFRSASQTLMSDVWVQTQDQGVVEQVGPGPDNMIFRGKVPAGALSLTFSAACYWTAALLD